MKTSKILTLLVLAVFAMSFSTALSQEKKTRRQIKKEQEDQFLVDLFTKGDIYFFQETYNSWLMMGSSGISYFSANSPGSDRKSGRSLHLSLVINDKADTILYDVEGKYKCDMLFSYPEQGENMDEIFLIGYTKGQKKVSVYQVVENDGEKYICMVGRWGTYLIYSMDDYDGSAYDGATNYSFRGLRYQRSKLDYYLEFE